MKEMSKASTLLPDGHILDWLPLLACYVDADGRVSYLNRNWAAFSGLGDRVAPFFWTDLIDGTERPLPCRCPDAMDYCVQRHVVLRHHEGTLVETDLHWQKLGTKEGGGWILFGHPETSDPLPHSGQSNDGSRRLPDPTILPLSQGVSPQILSPCDRASQEIGPSRTTSTCAQANPNAPSLDLNFTQEHRPDDDHGAHDPWAGLLSWDDFRNEAAARLAAASEKRAKIGFLLIDIDYLGDLNALYGRDIGDLVLKILAERLTLLSLGEWLVTRSGDDEFSVLITENVNVETLAARAQALLSFVDFPLRIGTQQVTFGLSIGASIFPYHGHSLAYLQNHAQLAVNDVKARGRGGYRLFDLSMKQQGEGQIAAQSNLIRGMLRDDLIYPAYQVKVCLTDGHIIGAEALMRWYHEGEVSCGPDAFPEIFRSYDLATRVSARVQERVFQDLVLWRSTGLEPPRISINVAPVEFMQDDYAEKLLARLDKFDLPPNLIELELTEHVLYQHSERYLRRALMLLSRAGMTITLDDFGTGYSSLSFLRDFPVSFIKIDRSFIRQICTEPSMEKIVEAIIRFGEAVSVDVVAEGIETAEQLAVLRRIGCPTGQGYLFSPPVASAGFARLLAEGRSLIPQGG